MKSSVHSSRSKSAPSKAAKKRTVKSVSNSRRRLTLKAAIKNTAIATELAPAVAIALLDKSEQLPGAPPAALDVLAAGVTPSATEGHVRVQLLFENGMVLPVEMTEAAGAALSDGLSGHLTKVE